MHKSNGTPQNRTTRLRRAVLALVAGALLLLAACSEPTVTDTRVDDFTSLQTAERYIVVLDADASATNPGRGRAHAADVARGYGLTANRTYGAAIVGFAAQVPSARVAALQADPRVAYIERDDPVQLFAQTVPTGIDRSFATGNPNLAIDGNDDLRVDVDVAVIDTGVDFEHPDLNVSGGVDCTVSSGGGPPWAQTLYCSATEGTGGDDDHYHGTHVAGTIGAIDDGVGVVGVAPGARIWAVKVLDSSGSGYESGIVAGIDWVAANADTIEVANMSLGGSGYSQAEYDAIQAAVDAGVAFAVAAGNSADDANLYSPAAFDNALTVSALADFDGAAGGNGSPTCRTDQDDTLADFSNWGTAVDLAAPGVCILSTYPLEQGEYATISGTSMASPHVAGALALLASVNNPGGASDVYALYDAVMNSGNDNWTDDSGDGLLEPLLDLSDETLYAPTMVGDGGGSNAAPTASFTADCTDLGCAFDGGGSSDSDGTISGYAWAFGDGATGSGSTASHTYAAGGTYTVTLTVTDDDGATGSSSQDVTVTEPSTGGFTLSATGTKVKGRHSVDLAWSGAAGTDVDVYRNGSVVTTTANDGAYTDATNNRGGASYSYQVCEAGTGTCSGVVTVVF